LGEVALVTNLGADPRSAEGGGGPVDAFLGGAFGAAFRGDKGGTLSVCLGLGALKVVALGAGEDKADDDDDGVDVVDKVELEVKCEEGREEERDVECCDVKCEAEEEDAFKDEADVERVGFVDVVCGKDFADGSAGEGLGEVAVVEVVAEAELKAARRIVKDGELTDEGDEFDITEAEEEEVLIGEE